MFSKDLLTSRLRGSFRWMASNKHSPLKIPWVWKLRQVPFPWHIPVAPPYSQINPCTTWQHSEEWSQAGPGFSSLPVGKILLTPSPQGASLRDRSLRVSLGFDLSRLERWKGTEVLKDVFFRGLMKGSTGERTGRELEKNPQALPTLSSLPSAQNFAWLSVWNLVDIAPVMSCWWQIRKAA